MSSQHNQAKRRRVRPFLEPLESRLVPYYQWNDVNVSASFIPDGDTSNLFAALNARYDEDLWQGEFARALAHWSAVTPLNFHFVSDDGSPSGTSGLSQGDSRFGDIRLWGYASGGTTLAYAYYPTSSTRGGDIRLNTSVNFNIGAKTDLFSVLLHESGHALGVDHIDTSGTVMYPTVNAVYSGLTAADIAAVQAIYGARQADSYDAQASNNTRNTAALLSLTSGVANLSADLTSLSDVDYYKVTAPSSTLTVSVDARNLSLLTPQVSVYNAAGNLVATQSASAYGSVASLTLNGLSSGSTYYIKVAGATTDVFGMGAYRLNVQFGGSIASAPELAPIADQTLTHSQNAVTVSLSAYDADSKNLSYSSQAVGYSPTYQWKQQLGIYSPGNNYYFNARGQSEKYLQGTGGQWFYLLPGGSLHQWAGSLNSSPLLTNLGTSCWTDPTQLCQAAAPAAPAVTLSFTGNQLNIDPASNYIGTFQVTVSVSDGAASASQSFLVNVTNVAPVLTVIADQSMSHNQDTLGVSLSASDADGDNLTYSARVLAYSPLYQWKQQLGIYSPGSNYYFNARGQNEKYLLGTGGQWYYLMPTGGLYQWGGSMSTSPLLANLGTTCWSDPLQLCQATAPATPAVTLSLAGNQLTINPADTYAGTFQVEVTASDGVASAVRAFLVNVTNSTPVLNAIADQTMSSTQDTLTVALNAGDADGDSLTYSARVVGYSQLYTWKQQLGVYDPGNNYYFNVRGQNEKYLPGTNGEWYYLLPTGALYQWRGSMSNSTLLVNLGGDCWADPGKLANAQAPATPPVTVSLNGSQLTINPASTYVGKFQVEVTVSDGVASSKRTFFVTVTS